jgi:hypothetical protein
MSEAPAYLNLVLSFGHLAQFSGIFVISRGEATFKGRPTT